MIRLVLMKHLNYGFVHLFWAYIIDIIRTSKKIETICTQTTHKTILKMVTK